MVSAAYFDGKSSRPLAIELDVRADVLLLSGAGLMSRVPMSEVRVSERLGSAPRFLRLPDGAFCEVRDLDGLAGLLDRTSHRDGWVDRWQRRWTTIAAAAALSAAIVAAAYRWGLPAAAELIARHLPQSIDRLLDEQTLSTLDLGILRPSKLDPAHQQRLRGRFAALRLPEAPVSAPTLYFRSSPAIGPNAFTLVNGSIIVLDELVGALGNDDQTVAVLAHEMGHAQGLHPLRQLIQGSAVAAFWAAYIGDVSSLLASAPAALLQARYSRRFEQDADDYAVELLRLNGLSPDLLADALKKIAAARKRGDEGVAAAYLSTHPSSEARIERIHAAARQQGVPAASGAFASPDPHP